MASTPLFPKPDNSFADMLQESANINRYVSTVTTNYAERLAKSPEDLSHLSLGSKNSTSVSSKTDECAVPCPLVNDDEVIVGEDAFKKAMRDYESTANEEYKTGINPDDEHTVAQLESLVDESIKRYQANDSRGFWGKIRLACKKLGENKENIEGWLGVLPSENQYLSVICGGLKLIVKAAVKLNENREKVLRSLESIPTLISNAQRVTIIYKDSNKLKLLSNTFYTSVLAALGHILKYLNNRAKVFKSTIRVLKAALLPSTFDNELQGKIDTVEKFVDAFETEANLCQKEQIHQAKQNTDATMNGINEMKQAMVHTATAQQEVNKDMMEIMLGVKRKQSDLGRDVSNLELTLMERIMKFLQSGDGVYLHAQMMMRQMDGSQNIERPVRDQDRRVIRSTTTATVQPTEAIFDQLFSQLNFDQRAVSFHLASIYNLGSRLSRDNQERGMFLIKAPKLTAWMESEKSAVLVVNGNVRRIERQSGLTFVCARLAFAFEGILSSAQSTTADEPRILPLYFFCGQHAVSHDCNDETANGVLNSILGQLLFHIKRSGLSLDLTKIVDLNKASQKGIKILFRCFKDILEQMSPDITVFCIIDALSVLLDDDETSHDAEQLMSQLLKLAQGKKRKNRCIFKLLLTAPKRHHSAAADGLNEENVLTLPPTLPNKGGFTETKWHYSISQQLESIEN